MKSFKLPKKKKLKSFFKLFLTLNLLFGLGALGLFFYFSYEKNNPLLSALPPFFSKTADSEVLSISAGPQPLVRISSYDFTPRTDNFQGSPSPDRNLGPGGGLMYGGVDNGSIFSSSCQNITNRTSFNVPDTQCGGAFNWFASPPLIQTWGSGGSQIPILFYSGGIYQVKDRNKVQLISRLYSSTNRSDPNDFNVCNRNWYPQAVERDLGDNFYFGHSALVVEASNCRSMVAGGPQQFYSNTASGSESNPNHFQYKLRLKNSNGNLSVDRVWVFYQQNRRSYSISNDIWNPNHRAFCYGKNLDGRCSFVTVHKQDEDSKIDPSQHWWMLTEGEAGEGSVLSGFGPLGFRSIASSEGDGQNNNYNKPEIYHYERVPKDFMCTTSAPYSSPLGIRRSYWQPGSSQCTGSYSGYDIPSVYFQANFPPFFNPSVGGFTYKQPYPRSGNLDSEFLISYRSTNPSTCGQNCSQWRGFNHEIALGSNAIEMANFRLYYINSIFNDPTNIGRWPQATYISELQSPSNIKADFASDAYFFKLNFINGRLSVYRFGLSELPYNQSGNIDFLTNTGLAQLDIVNPGSLNTSNISFNVNGRGDLDILFAPNPDSVNSSSRSRIFRIPNFNNVNPLAYSNKPPIFELTDSSNGYGISSSGAIGVESPLSFRYVNVSDGNLVNDYAVFATRNSVWTANIPYDCTINNVIATLQTNPNSRLNGVVVPTNGSDSYNLGFTISPDPVINCGGSNIPINGYTLQLIDPLSTNTTPSRNLLSVGNLTNPSFSNNFVTSVRRKWDLKLFANTSNNTSIQIPIRGSVSNGNFSYIEEGTVQIRVFKDVGNNLTQPYNGARFSISQTILTAPSTIVKSPITVNLGSTTNSVFLNSSGIGGFFNDHWLYTLPNTSISDRVSTRICFLPQNQYQTTNMKIKIISIPDSNLISLAREGNLCFSLQNVRNSSGPYQIRSDFVFNALLEGVDAPPASEVTNDLRNISFNSNVTNLTTESLKGETSSSSARDGNYFFSVDGASSSSFNKNLKLASSISTLFKFPIRFTLPTSAALTAPRTTLVNPSNCNSTSLGLINIFTSSGNCSISANSLNFSSSSLKLIFINNGSVSIDLNASLPSQLPIIRNTYFINNNSTNTPNVVMNLNCDTTPSPFLCTESNRFFMSGGLISNAKFSGRLSSTQANSIKSTINQTGDVLPVIQNYLYSNIATNISIRKVILKYK